MESPRELLKNEPFVTVKMWNGQMASVPTGAAKEFQERQEILKRQKQEEKAKEENKKPNFDEAIRATEEMFGIAKSEQKKDMQLQQVMAELEVIKVQNKTMQNAIKELSTKNKETLNNKTMENQIKKKATKTRFFIAVYIILIIIELFFCVPYHEIQIFITENWVPHTEIVGSGYAPMPDISRDEASIRISRLKSNELNTSYGKIINTAQLFLNVSITTIIFATIYWIFIKNKKGE